MADKETNRLNDRNIYRDATSPYTIQLDNEDYTLTEEILKRNTESQTQRSKDWPLPKLKFISFKEGKLELQNTYNKTSYILTILIEKDRLNVSCSCGIQVEMLCVHEYEAFNRMACYASAIHFDVYKPNGLLDIGMKYKKYFTIKPSQRGLDISPKRPLGSVYQLSNRVPSLNINDLLKLSVDNTPQHSSSNEVALSYLIVNSHRNELLPFLLPCIGKLNKAGTEIKSFHSFISGTQKKYDSILNEEQRELNKICYNMWRIVENLPGEILNETQVESATQKIQEVFKLWCKAIPLLLKQKFLYSYQLYGKRELKGRPGKRRIEEIRIVNEPPTLRFQLIDNQVFCQFKMNFFSKGQQIGNYDLDTPFFLKKGTRLYLLACLRDAAIIEWMVRSGGLITVFKEHFPQFEIDILNQIRGCYPIDEI